MWFTWYSKTYKIDKISEALCLNFDTCPDNKDVYTYTHIGILYIQKYPSECDDALFREVTQSNTTNKDSVLAAFSWRTGFVVCKPLDERAPVVSSITSLRVSLIRCPFFVPIGSAAVCSSAGKILVGQRDRVDMYPVCTVSEPLGVTCLVRGMPGTFIESKP